LLNKPHCKKPFILNLYFKINGLNIN